ncbi:hypothetical protein BJX76DRAFT_299853 [Aspergillus varians]
MEDMIEFVCRHYYCRDCVRQQARYRFPPTCCENPVPEQTVLQCLSANETATLKLKFKEQRTPLSKRWYCPDKSCGKWIHPKQLVVEGSRFSRSRTNTCPYCKVSICPRCRTHSHAGDCPPADINLVAVLALADSKKWRKCFHCGTLVEKINGCDSITCQCGVLF